MDKLVPDFPLFRVKIRSSNELISTRAELGKNTVLVSTAFGSFLMFALKPRVRRKGVVKKEGGVTFRRCAKCCFLWS